MLLAGMLCFIWPLQPRASQAIPAAFSSDVPRSCEVTFSRPWCLATPKESLPRHQGPSVTLDHVIRLKP